MRGISDNTDRAASAKRTPKGRGLSRYAAATLSKRGDKMRDTGMDVIFNRVIYKPILQDNEWSIWSIGQNDRICIQLQPSQTLSLISNLASVPMPLFASLNDQYGNEQSREMADAFACLTDVEVNSSITTDLSIIGGDLARFRHAVHNYGHTIDKIFDLKEIIASAIYDFFTRVLTYIDSKQLGANDERTARMIQYGGKHVQQILQQIYARVYATSEEIDPQIIANLLTSQPDLSPMSEFSMSISSICFSSRSSQGNNAPAGGMLKIPKALKLLKNPKISKTISHLTPAIAPASALGPIPAQAHVHTKSICCWHISSLGCDKGSFCTFDHRKPTAGDRQTIKNFFDKHSGGVKGQQCIQTVF